MTYKVKVFGGHTPALDLVAFVNTNAIPRDNIQHQEIFDGLWYLYWWE